MKKIAVLAGAIVTSMSAFAYYGDYHYYSSHSDDMSGFEIFSLVVMIAYIILSIIILVRWWKMTKNVDLIRQHVTHANPKLTYLVAIGEKEKAQKAALIMLVDLLYPIYNDQYESSKATAMNKVIEAKLPKMQRLGITVPDYVTSGEKFIDYINGLTNGKVQYEDPAPDTAAE